MSNDTDATVTTAAAVDDDAELILGADDGGADIVLTLKGYRERTAEIRFKGDYPGMYVKTWINCPRSLLTELSSSDSDVADKALAAFIVDHNLVWSDGTPLPSPLTAKAVRGLDVVLTNKIVKLGIEAIQKASGIDPR